MTERTLSRVDVIMFGEQVRATWWVEVGHEREAGFPDGHDRQGSEVTGRHVTRAVYIAAGRPRYDVFPSFSCFLVGCLITHLSGKRETLPLGLISPYYFTLLHLATSGQNNVVILLLFNVCLF